VPENFLSESPPRLNAKEKGSKIADAFEPFGQYIQYLAQGKLDGFLDSIRREDKVVPELNVTMPTDPILLLHNLGKDPETERIENLFVHNTVFVALDLASVTIVNINLAPCRHLFSPSGAGKTRLSLDGLCSNWGFYFSCQSKANCVSGSSDFEAATDILVSMSSWNLGTEDKHIYINKIATDRVFAMLLCARVFVLKRFMDYLPASTDVGVARRRWVLLQVMPPCLVTTTLDIFTVLVQSLRSADTDDMLNFVITTLRNLHSRKDLFPVAERVNNTTPLFVVIDEAQVAADKLSEHFRSTTTGTDLRPILHAFYRFLGEGTIDFAGIIISGTGLSTEMVENPMGSLFAKRVDRSGEVFVDTGLFRNTESFQEKYVRRYLKLSENNVSEKRLLERILHWFSGRCVVVQDCLIYADT
jgi:hypothetical protein